MKKIRVLQVVPSLSRSNGVAEYICNYFNNINMEKFEFTFLVLNKRDNSRYKEILEKNGKIVEIFKEKNIFKYFSKINDFFKINHFDIVHCHVPNYGMLILYYAKKYNTKVRIIHSHATISGETCWKRIRNNFLIYFTKYNSNAYFACSKKAGEAMFKKKSFEIINNAINLEKYKFSEEYRNEIRNDLNIAEDVILLGNIGRFCKQKNQIFLLKILEKLKIENSKKYKLILVGNGELEDFLKKEINKKNLNEDVIILTNRDDINKIYNAIDIFLLPSLYEGLPVVGIEAQASGMPIIFSNTITNELKIKENIYFLNSDEEEWIKMIKECSEFSRIKENNLMNLKYNIKVEAKKMEKIYINLLMNG